jgi:endonuclease III
MPSTPKSRRIPRITAILTAAYGDRVWRSHGPPIDELVKIILSQNTNDRNSLEAFRRLKQKFPRWEQLLNLPEKSIAAPIAIGGLANIKAKRLKQILREIKTRQGALSLDFLKTMPPTEANRELQNFVGVGAKTAACVLLFSFGMPVFPVDTHIHRVAIRLGLIGPATTAVKAHDELAAIIPPQLVYPFHLLLIEHGRRICHARHPQCTICPLLTLCPAGKQFIAQGKNGDKP